MHNSSEFERCVRRFLILVEIWYIIRVYGNVVYWKSKKQGSVTKSSTAAEYVALSESISELKVIINLLKEFNVKIKKPINVYEDNSGAVAIAKFGNFTKNSKYIEVHYHFVYECYEKGINDIVKIDSENNIISSNCKG